MTNMSNAQMALFRSWPLVFFELGQWQDEQHAIEGYQGSRCDRSLKT